MPTAMYATIEQLRAYLPQIQLGSENDTTLTATLTRATGMVRDAMRVLLADATFDYAAYGAASTKIVRGFPSLYLTIPAHQSGSVTLVEYESGTNPSTYATVADQWLEEDGRLYRSYGWSMERYRITAIWGYGATVPAAIEELSLELAVNLWRARDKGGMVETVGATGGGAIRIVSGLNEQQQAILLNTANQIKQGWV